MAQKFTIHDTVVTQKICSNHSWMKGISSYVYPFFLFKRGKKTNNCRLYSASHDNMTSMELWTEKLVKRTSNDCYYHIPALKENKLTLIQPAAISKEELMRLQNLFLMLPKIIIIYSFPLNQIPVTHHIKLLLVIYVDLLK